MFFAGAECKNCGEVLRFLRDKKCVSCVRARDRKRGKTEHRRKHDRARYARDPEGRKVHVRRWREQNPDRRVAGCKSWRERNPEKVRKHSSNQYYRDPKKAQAACDAWAARNPEKARKIRRAAEKARKIRKRGASGSHTVAETIDLFARQDGQCFYCATAITFFHEDHFIPLAKNGTNDIANIRLACVRCNCSKHEKLPRDFFIQVWNSI